jgi:hypothetical protein
MVPFRTIGPPRHRIPNEKGSIQQAMAALRGGYTKLTFLDELAVLQIFKKFTPIIRNPEDHDRCHNSPSLVHVVKQISLVDTPPSVLFLLRSILILYWT